MATPYQPSADFGPSGPGGGDSPFPPAPGELHLKERRSWRTWQLIVASAVALLVGMALNYHTAGANASSNAPAYTLPQATGSTTTTPTTAGSSSGSTTTTTAAGGSTTTTTGVGGSTTTSTTTSAAAGGPARVLMGPTQMQGNWTSPAFTTTVAGWNIGWAFQCSPAPASGPSFEVFVTPAGSSPTGTPAVNGTGASGQSVTSQSSLGSQTLVVKAPAGCTWVVKVTGS